MENYFSNFLLASEIDNPQYFATVHQHIYDLEKHRVAIFNAKGPLNWEYISIMGELNMAYMEAKDTLNEVATAKQIYQGTVAMKGENDSLSYEAYLALGSSLLDDERISDAQAIATQLLAKNTIVPDAESQEAFDYLTYLDTLCLQADIYHKTQAYGKEEPLRIKVMEAYAQVFTDINDQTIMARAALAACLEKAKRYPEALDHYIVIRSYLDVEKDLATDAERIGLMAHIAHCYRKVGNLEDSKVVLQWALQESIDRFGVNSTLAAKMKAIAGNT
jgi:tetratricopeptide (TPR) repeat protein